MTDPAWYVSMMSVDGIAEKISTDSRYEAVQFGIAMEQWNGICPFQNQTFENQIWK